MPEALKERLHCPDDSVGFLERLYGLEDPRGYLLAIAQGNRNALEGEWSNLVNEVWLN